jgi:hypothetical protein
VVSDQLVRPSKWWFAVAGAVAVVGIVLGIVILVVGFLRMERMVDDFARADVPGTLEVEVTDTGGYSIYHEFDGAYDDRIVAAPQITVTEPSGDGVTLEPYVASVTYSAGDREGVGIFTFDADDPGTYEVTATGASGTAIAVGRGIGRGIVGAVVGGLAIGFLSLLAGAVLAIVVGVRRSRNRRALLPPRPPYAGWGPMPPPGGGAPGPAGPPVAPRAGGYGSAPGGSPYPGAAPPGSSLPLSAPGARPASSAWAPSPPGSGFRRSGSGAPPAPAVHGSGALAAAGPAPAPLDPPAPRPESRPQPHQAVRRSAGAVDPPSLRAPADWSRSDLPLPWSSERG